MSPSKTNTTSTSKPRRNTTHQRPYIVRPPPPPTHHSQTNPEATHSEDQYPTPDRLANSNHQLKHRSAEIAHARRPDPGANDPGLWLRCDDGSISASPVVHARGLIGVAAAKNL
ncbi:hypothetical protein PENPOL_c006G01660 [Penicillium polonicum]|uniref:Uncharacterized protein n=1 Tax=Penicillium polonicum TaxID=60169 RepID=A0A1V6NKV1_PENPO|nr:hypothetical protein PENPOL_c006G01660 [Penicillium polonicum]